MEKRTQGYYQTKKINEVMEQYDYTEDKATAIVMFCGALNNGMIIHWVINGACKYVESFEQCEIDFSLSEILQLFKKSYVDTVGDVNDVCRIKSKHINELLEIMNILFYDYEDLTDNEIYLKLLKVNSLCVVLGIEDVDIEVESNSFVDNKAIKEEYREMDMEDYIKMCLLR